MFLFCLRQQLRRFADVLAYLMRMRIQLAYHTLDASLMISVQLSRQQLYDVLACLHVLNLPTKARLLNICRLMERLQQWFVQHIAYYSVKY